MVVPQEQKQEEISVSVPRPILSTSSPAIIPSPEVQNVTKKLLHTTKERSSPKLRRRPSFASKSARKSIIESSVIVTETLAQEEETIDQVKIKLVKAEAEIEKLKRELESERKNKKLMEIELIRANEEIARLSNTVVSQYFLSFEMCVLIITQE